MLYYVLRPSSLSEAFPTFTRYGGLSKCLSGRLSRAQACLGRVYSTDGHSTSLVSDYYVEPTVAPSLKFKPYWRARAQAALFV